jgi:ATP-dependent helicase/nuclease subunit B
LITDYKTGTPPSKSAVNALHKPQLPLEGAILAAGGFGAVASTGSRIAGTVLGLRYIKASGGEPAGIETDIKTDDLANLIERAAAGLTRLVARFDDPATPYAVARRAKFSYDFDPYTQLARVAEWSATGTAEVSSDDANDTGEAT